MADGWAVVGPRSDDRYGAKSYGYRVPGGGVSWGMKTREEAAEAMRRHRDYLNATKSPAHRAGQAYAARRGR